MAFKFLLAKEIPSYAQCVAVQRAGYAVCEGCIRSRGERAALRYAATHASGRAQLVVVRSWAPSPIRKNSLYNNIIKCGCAAGRGRTL